MGTHEATWSRETRSNSEENDEAEPENIEGEEYSTQKRHQKKQLNTAGRRWGGGGEKKRAAHTCVSMLCVCVKTNMRHLPDTFFCVQR